MSGPRLISRSLPAITDKVFSRKYIMLGRLVTHWQEIVGEDLASKAQPVKLSRRRKGKGKALETTLHIAANTAHATTLHYQKNLILERINQIFGEKLVTAIRFVPVVSNAPGAQRKRKHSNRRKTLTPRQKQRVETIISNIDDPEIHERLKSLGEYILKDNSEP